MNRTTIYIYIYIFNWNAFTKVAAFNILQTSCSRASRPVVISVWRLTRGKRRQGVTGQRSRWGLQMPKPFAIGVDVYITSVPQTAWAVGVLTGGFPSPAALLTIGLAEGSAHGGHQGVERGVPRQRSQIRGPRHPSDLLPQELPWCSTHQAMVHQILIPI